MVDSLLLVIHHFQPVDGLLFLFLVLVFWRARVKRHGEIWADPFSKDQGLALRGIFACAVMFDHLAGYCCPHAAIFSRTIYWGDLSVAVFFGLSGYGLMKQLQKNASYLKGFWGHRLRLLLPSYAVMTLLVLAQGIRGDFDILHRLTSKFGLVIGGWYVLVLLVFYFIFWGGNHVQNQSREFRLIFVIICAVLWTAISSFFAEPFFYARNGAFVAGLLVGWGTEASVLFIRTYKKTLCLIGVGIFIFYTNYTMYILQEPLAKYIACMLFVPVLVLFSTKIQLGNIVLNGLGQISYEIYLVHMFVLEELQHWFPWDGNKMVFAVVGLTVLISIALHWVIGKLISPFQHKNTTAAKA